MTLIDYRKIYNSEQTINEESSSKSSSLLNSSFSINIDVLKDFDSYSSYNESLFLFDLDNTLIETERLKVSLQKNLCERESKITAQIWDQTYNLAKPHSKFYDYILHSKLLSEYVNNSFSSEDIQKIIEETVYTKTNEFLYSNMFEFIKKLPKTVDIGIFTTGFGDFQRIKVLSIINNMSQLPIINIFVSHILKGAAIKTVIENEYFHKIQLNSIFLNKKRIVLFDDNTDEIKNMYLNTPFIELVRVKQRGGKYNDNLLDDSIKAINLDLQNNESIYFK